MNENAPISDALLVRYSLDEATAEEKQEVEAWLSSSEVHQEEYNQIIEIWANAKEIADFDAINMEQNWEGIQMKLARKTLEKQTESSSFSIAHLWKIAAAIIVVFSLTWYFASNYYEETIVVDAHRLQGGEYLLPDGSKVWLRGTSTISYTSAYGEKERRVQLRGEGYFEVTHNEEVPFIAESNNATTRVLGTSFNLKDNRKRKTTALILVSGKVDFSTTKEHLIIEPGELVFANAQKELLKTKNRDLNFMSWKTGILQFKDTEMKDVIKDLASFYNVKIKIERRSFSVCTLTSTFDNVPLEEILETLELLFGIEVVKNENDEYLLKGKGC